MKALITLPIIPVLVLLWAALLPVEPLTLCFWSWISVVPFIVLSSFTIFVGRKYGFTRLAVTTGLASVVFAASIVATQWPLRLGFWVSSGEFDAVASNIQNARSVSTPFWIGPFKIKGTETNAHGIVCLWTDPTPGDHDGFVRTSRDFLPFNLWSSVKLSDRWQYIAED